MAELSNASYRRGLADGADEEAPVRDSDEDYLRGYAEGRLDPARALAALLVAAPAPRLPLDVIAARHRAPPPAPPAPAPPPAPPAPTAPECATCRGLRVIPDLDGQRYPSGAVALSAYRRCPACSSGLSEEARLYWARQRAVGDAVGATPAPAPEPDLGSRFTLLEVD